MNRPIGIMINEICESFPDKYICWGFEIVCKNKGDCDKCDIMNEYIEYSNKEKDDGL